MCFSLGTLCKQISVCSWRRMSQTMSRRKSKVKVQKYICRKCTGFVFSWTWHMHQECTSPQIIRWLFQGLYEMHVNHHRFWFYSIKSKVCCITKQVKYQPLHWQTEGWKKYKTGIDITSRDLWQHLMFKHSISSDQNNIRAELCVW